MEIVLSTMNRNSLDFLIPMFPFCHFSEFSMLIINQTKDDNLLVSEFPSIRVINSFEMGLSKSRNLGLKHAQGELLVITDDDVVFQANFHNVIEYFFKTNNADIVLFKAINSKGFPIRKYPKKHKLNLNIFDIINAHSFEMVMRKSAIAENKIVFDENFGLGTDFPFGEELILLKKAKGLKMSLAFCPETIVCHHDEVSVLKMSLDRQYYVQGAVFYRVFNRFYIAWILLKTFFDLKQKRIHLTAFFTLFNNAINGKKAYQNKINNSYDIFN